MKKVGDALEVRIVGRTKSGLDVKNKRFKRYSEGYAKRKGVQRNQVNLTLHRDMLDSIKVKSRKNIAIIKSTDKKGIWHQYGAGRLPIRGWFGIGPKFERILKVLIGREFRRLNKKKVI